MSKSARLRVRDLRAIYELTGECRDLGDDPVGWRRHYFARLAGLTGADVAVGGEMAGLKGGSPRGLGTTDWGWEHGFDRRGWARAIELLRTDPTYSPVLNEYGRRFVSDEGAALSRTDMTDESAWRRSVEYQEVYRTGGVDQTVYCLRPVPGTADEVSGAFLLRSAGRPDFTAREKATIREFHAQITPLVGGVLARFAEPSPADLPPRARQVLRCLLEGDSDKQIARRLGISPHTVNQYTKAIYRHFGVRSRPVLMARWVRRGWANGFGWANE